MERDFSAVIRPCKFAESKSEIIRYFPPTRHVRPGSGRQLGASRSAASIKAHGIPAMRNSRHLRRRCGSAKAAIRRYGEWPCGRSKSVGPHSLPPQKNYICIYILD